MTKLSGQNLRFDHNFMLGSAVYKLMKENSEEASNAFHDSPYRSTYVLSEIYNVKGKKGEYWFRIGTTSQAVAKIIGGSFESGTNIIIGSTEFQVTEILMEEPIIRPGEYITLSPILLRDRVTGKSIVYDSPGYIYKEVLENAINLQIKNYLKKNGVIKVKEFDPQAVRKRTIKDRIVLAQKGRMLLDGEIDQLLFLVNHGIGNSPALGFGMIVPGIPLDQIMMIGFDKLGQRRKT